MKLRSTRVFVSVQNLWTLTDYTGWDPEVSFNPGGQTTTNDNLIQGNDFYTAPQDRTFVVGINVGL
jgi:TonB-dependent starch-binding outer membrane protein SusC